VYEKKKQVSVVLLLSTVCFNNNFSKRGWRQMWYFLRNIVAVRTASY